MLVGDERSTPDGTVSRVLEVPDGHGRGQEHGLILTCAHLHAIAVVPPEPPLETVATTSAPRRISYS